MTGLRSSNDPAIAISVSGIVPSTLDVDVATNIRPRADYRVIAEALGAEVIDYDVARSRLGRTGRLVEQIAGSNVMLALALVRWSGSALLTDGEQVGLPYAALSRFRRHRPNHHMIVHIMSVPKKVLLFRLFRLRSLIDQFLVYSSRQQDLLIEHGVAGSSIALTTFMVDTDFFDPRSVDATSRRMICSAGLEYRDYETLIEAVRGLDVDVVIAAASPWSRRTNSIDGAGNPSNVSVCSLDFVGLRRLYAEAEFVVMPLKNVDFQAGITTILEAMSMAKPVVCTRTPGQSDTVIDGQTGLFVPPGDAAALRNTIIALLDDPERVRTMGESARQWTVENADIDVYARRIAEHVR